MTATGGRRVGWGSPESTPANVLLQAPVLSDGTIDICPRLADGDERDLLLVSLSGDPERRLDAWRRHGGLPSKVAVLSTGARGATTADGGAAHARGPGGATVETATVSEPGDLTGLGIRMNQCLSAWEDDDAPTVICFDSVTTVLQYADVERAFRFFHVMSRRVDAIDAFAHYHIDPGAHDERVLSTLRSVFPAVLEYDPDEGAWNERR